MEEKCAVKRCKGIPYLTYCGRPVCIDCWSRHCEENNKFNLKKALNIIEEKIRG